MSVRVLFYPERPHRCAAIRKICRAGGWKWVFRPDVPCDLAIHWDTATVRRPCMALYAPVVLNAQCGDVSKTRVANVFARVFGYALGVDPLSFDGLAVRKSDENATHDGTVVRCPLAGDQLHDGFIYQRLIANEAEDYLVEDLRAVIIGEALPLAYRKLRPAADRFSNLNRNVACLVPDSVFSAKEIARLMQFARELGMDYGELDVLRDRGNGRLYVVDANPTPWGPPNHLSRADSRFAVERMTRAFEDQVLAIAAGAGIDARL